MSTEVDGQLRRGVYLPPFGPFGDPMVLVEVAVRAEAAGWGGVFLWDHVVSDALPIADCWTSLSAMAIQTRRILIGSTVTPLPRRRPWIVARQASTVSRLSGGRAVLGVGLGSDESGDFSRFGEESDLATRSTMLDEALEVVRSVWAGRSHGPDGNHYSVDLAQVPPDPFRIPVWMASSSRHRRVLERAAGCDGIFPISVHTLDPDGLSQIVHALRRAGAPLGRDFDVIVSGNASSAWERPNPDNVDLAGLANEGATWWLESLIHFDPLELSLEVIDAGPPEP